MSLSSASDEASFLHPRDPSILGWNQRVRFVAPVKKQLFSEIIEEENCHDEATVIQTFLRPKPLRDNIKEQATFSILNDTTIITHAPKDSASYKTTVTGRVVHQYGFTKVFPPEAPQKYVFDECVAFQVKDFIQGTNSLLFAYGTTNAGKTFTIQGDSANPGIIPRALDLLFKSIRGQVTARGRFKPERVEGIVQLDSATESQELEYKNRILQWSWDKPLEPIKSCNNVSSSSNSTRNSETDFISSTFREMQKTLSSDSPIDLPLEGDVVYGVWVSFAEVYNESVYDLLDPIVIRGRKRIPLRLAQDTEGNLFIRDLKLIHVSSGDEAFHVMLYGKANLKVAATNMNSHSSRSHCIFTIKLVRYSNCDNPSYAIVSSFTFCDLAGAERVKKTLNVGDRLKESNNINTSLHVLGRCLATIRENQRKKERKPVPFRDSKLTRIFQRALTGQERITMIVNANMTPQLYDETVNVLKFSAMAKQIIFEAPIKKAKPMEKKSRFSIMVTHQNPHGTMCWDVAPKDVTGSLGEQPSTETSVQKYNAQNEELLMLVENLKDQLAEERHKNLTQEKEIRKSVTETFSKIMDDMENSWKKRMKDMEERNENLSSWRITQLENYYKQQLEGNRKRRRESDMDDSIVVCNSPQQDQKIQELEEEVKLLEKKSIALHQLLKEAQEIQASLSSEKSILTFELATANAELEKYRRQFWASEKEADGTQNALVNELKVQLAEEEKKLKEERQKNQNLRDLLDEAKQDYVELTKERDEADLEVSKLQKELVEKYDELTEMNEQTQTLQLSLSQNSRNYNNLEERFETLLKAQEICKKNLNEISALLLVHESNDEVEELQSRVKTLSVLNETSAIPAAPENLSEVLVTKIKQYKQMECDHEGLKKQLEDLKLHHDNHLQSLESLEKTKKDYENLLNLLKSEKSTQDDEIKQLQNSLSDSEKLKLESDSRINQAENDVKLLQKDLKDVLQRNVKLEQELIESKKELQESHINISRLEQELKSLIQKSSSQLNASSASSHSEFEALQSKVKAHEQNIEYLKAWKEDSIQLNQELKEALEENKRLTEELKIKEAEMENFNTNRNQLMSRYEEALKKAQEEVEREKREVISLRDALYKSTPTPKKNESAELRLLKDRIEQLQTELLAKTGDLPQSTKKAPKSSKKVSKQESYTSNESLKENVEEVQVACAPCKGTTSVSEKEIPKSSNKKKPVKDLSNPAPSVEEKPQRKKGRNLFTRNQTQSFDSDDVEAIEVDYLRTTTPDSFVKRSLRNRKV